MGGNGADEKQLNYVVLGVPEMVFFYGYWQFGLPTVNSGNVRHFLRWRLQTGSFLMRVFRVGVYVIISGGIVKDL